MYNLFGVPALQIAGPGRRVNQGGQVPTPGPVSSRWEATEGPVSTSNSASSLPLSLHLSLHLCKGRGYGPTVRGCKVQGVHSPQQVRNCWPLWAPTENPGSPSGDHRETWACLDSPVSLPVTTTRICVLWDSFAGHSQRWLWPCTAFCEAASPFVWVYYASLSRALALWFLSQSYEFLILEEEIHS